MLILQSTRVERPLLPLLESSVETCLVKDVAGRKSEFETEVNSSKQPPPSVIFFSSNDQVFEQCRYCTQLYDNTSSILPYKKAIRRVKKIDVNTDDANDVKVARQPFSDVIGETKRPRRSPAKNLCHWPARAHLTFCRQEQINR